MFFSWRILAPLLALVAVLGVFIWQRSTIMVLRSDLDASRAQMLVCKSANDTLKAAVEHQNTAIINLRDENQELYEAAKRRVNVILNKKWKPPEAHGAEEMNRWIESYK